MYTLSYHPLVLKDLQHCPPPLQKRLLHAIEVKLTTTPELFGKPLRHHLKGYYRLRVGDYRVIYSISQEKVTVYILHIGPRRDQKVYQTAQQRTG